MKLDERLEEIQALVTTLSAGRCGHAELKRVKRLIAEEGESMERSKAIADNERYSPTYRSGMRTAVGNSQQVIRLLKHAYNLMRKGMTSSAADTLNEALRVRSRRKPQKDTPTKILTDYATYLLDTDTDFAAWRDHRG